MDVGAVSLRYADSLSVSAATFTPDFRFESDRAAAQVTGTFSQFLSGGWSAQGTTSGSLFSRTRRNLLGELAGLGGGSVHQDGTKTGQAIANGRLHAMRSRTGVFVGLGGGATWDGIAWRRLIMGEAGGWLHAGRVMGLLTLTPVQVNDSIRYVDGQLIASQSQGRIDLSLLAGARAGSQNPSVDTRTRVWGSLNAVAWLAPRLAVVASGGTYPVDPTQGFPGGRFLSVGLRLGTTQGGPALPAPETLPTPKAAEAVVATRNVDSFALERRNRSSAVFRVGAREAHTVEIAGDFSRWAPVKLEAAGEGQWTVSLPLEPGQYQMNLRIDGGDWLVPPGLLPLKDEFGGSVGLLIVE